MLGAWKTNKSLSRQGSGRSPLEGVAEALRSTLLWRVAPLSLFPHRISVVRVYVYMAIATTDLAGRDLRQSSSLLGPST